MILKFLLCLILITTVFTCTQDSDCDYQLICVRKTCTHKSVFPPDYLDGLAFILSFVTAVLSVISGLGGGVLYSAFFIILLNFSTNVSVPISSFNIVCSSILKFVWEMIDRHRKKEPSNVRYDIAAMFTPSVMVGTQFGVMLNIILRPWMLSILLFIITILSSIPSSTKGIQIFKKEQIENRMKNSHQADEVMKDEEAVEEISPPTPSTSEVDTINEKTVLGFGIANIEEEIFGKGIMNSFLSILSNKQIKTEEPLRTININETAQFKSPNPKTKPSPPTLTPAQERFRMRARRLFPLDYVAYIVLTVVFLLIITLLKGRKGNSVIDTVSCSDVWWMLSFIMIPIALTILFFIVLKMRAETKAMIVAKFSDPLDTIIWDKSTISWMIGFGLLVGLMSSLLGVGGSFLTVPLFLKFGLTPQKSSSTASFIAMLSAISSTIQYMLFNLLYYDYAFMTAVGSLIGAFAALYWFLPHFRKFNRQSLIVLTLVLTLYISAGLNLYIGVDYINSDVKADVVWNTKPVC